MKLGKTYLFLGAGFFALLLVWLGYFSPRAAFGLNFFIIALQFGLLYGLTTRIRLNDGQVKGWLFFSLFLRIVLLVAIPQLSDDYFRFIWDGQLLLSGISPYQYTPHEILPTLLALDSNYFQGLVEKLNSPNYYSVYPPSNQLIFALSAWAGGKNLLFGVASMRLILIAFEGGVILLLWKIAKWTDQKRKKILLYALNPLVIIEITGNLHFEGVMLFFLLAGFYSFLKNRKHLGFWFGTAVGIKLTPLILGPLWLRYLSKNQLYFFVLTAGVTMLFLFFPLFEMLPNYMESIRLYYGKFEFNAGIYYFVRYVSMWWIPYNPIGYISPIMTGLAAILIVWVAWKKPLSTIFEHAVLTYLIYLLLHTVVHPWYLIVPLGLSVLTPYRLFPAWSFLVFLSYASYSTPETIESPVLLFLQYGIVLGVGFSDYFRWRSNAN